MALIGNLKDFGLPEFLYLVDRGYKTGRLTLTKPGDRAELYFLKGKLVYATHFGHDERIGDILVRMGKITQEQINNALRIQHQQEPNKPLGTIMVSRNMISQEEIQKCLQMQIEEITYNLFNWHEGEFKFEQDIQPPVDTLLVHLSVENIIMEGTRRIDEWTRIRDKIPSLDILVRFCDQPQEKARSVNLTPDEWRVFARINGDHTIRQIANQTGMGEFEVARIIYGFLSAGLVLLAKPAPVYSGVALSSRPGLAPASISNNSNGNHSNTPVPQQVLAAREEQISKNGHTEPSQPDTGSQVAPPRYKKSLIRRIIDAIARR